MKRLNLHKAVLLSISAVLASSCQYEERGQASTGYIEIRASLDNGSTKVSLQPTETLDLQAKWQGFEYIKMFCEKGSNYYDESVSVQISDVSEDGSSCVIRYYVPDEWNSFFGHVSEYNLKCFTSICHPEVIDDTLYFNGSLQRERLSSFVAPVYFFGTVEEGTVDGTFQHYYAYELLHIKNSSDKNISFRLNGFSSSKIWYREQCCIRADDMKAIPSAEAKWTSSNETFNINAGETEILVSAYIPTGYKINDATMVANIDGRDIRSSNTKSSNAELKVGHAYHMYADWDGKELEFIDNPQNGSLEVSVEKLEFGDVEIGTSDTLKFMATNSSISSNVNVSFDFKPADGPFKLNDVYQSVLLQPRETGFFEIIFTPTAECNYSSTLAIITDAAAKSYSISLSGNGIKTEPEPVFEAVDLGLSVKWASCNLGASKPEGYGDYYAWGATKTWDGYGNAPYDASGTCERFTKYVPYDEPGSWVGSGNPDGKTVLDAEDDVASAQMGAGWRMPTVDEFKELKNNCSSEWITIGGVSGMKFTSNVPGYTDRWIFLPASGSPEAIDDITNLGVYGWYWSSSLYSATHASSMLFRSDGVFFNNYVRECGFSIRPVYDEGASGQTALAISPGEVDFGTVYVGESASASFTIINTGRTVASVSISTPSNPVTSDVSGDITINAGASRTVTLTFSPKNKGSYGGRILVSSNGTSFNVLYDGNCIEKNPDAPDIVDLGLSVKWAAWNLGAKETGQVGKFYSWGETMGNGEEDLSNESNFIYAGTYVKTYYDDQTYKYYKWDGTYSTGSLGYSFPNGYYTKYTNGNDQLLPEDDAAYQHLGEGWRMPTEAELRELIENTTAQYSGSTVILTSKKPGFTDKSITIPIDGNLYQNRHVNYAYGQIWSSTNCCILEIHKRYGISVSRDARSYGVHIRPVYTR